jgi:hypothetical protein
VVADHEQRPAAVAELGRQRLAAVVPDRVGGIDAPGAEGQLGAAARRGGRLGRRRRGAARPVDELQVGVVGAEQERDADVAVGLAAVLVRGRVDLAVVVGRAAGGLDRRQQARERDVRRRRRRAGGAVVVLDLLEAEDVRRAQVADDLGRDAVVAVLRVEPIKVLDVVAGDRELVAVLLARDLGLQLAVGERRSLSARNL